MEEPVSLRGVVLILVGVFGGAWLLTVLTVAGWPLILGQASPVGPGVTLFTLPKGAFLGFLSSYALESTLAGRPIKAARLLIGWGGAILLLFVVLLIFGTDAPTSRSLHLAWDGFTALWALAFVVTGNSITRSQRKVRPPSP